MTLAGRMVAMTMGAGSGFGALAVVPVAGVLVQDLLEGGDFGGAGCCVGGRNDGEDGDDQGQRR